MDRNHRRRKAYGGLVAACSAVALLLGGSAIPAAHADPREDKARVDRQLAETQATLEAATDRARQAAGELATVTALLPGAETSLADAKGRVIGAQAAVRQAEREVQVAQEAERAAGGEYTDAVAAVERGRGEVTGFVTAAYKGSAFMAVNSILASGSPSEFATQLGYLDQVAEGQQRALDVVTTARLVAKQRADAALLARQRAEGAREAARRAHEAALTAQSDAERADAQLRTLVEQRERALVSAEQERSSVLARYEQLRADSDRLGAELRSIATREARARGGGGGFGPGGPPPRPHPGGYFLMPVAGWKSSDFGMRYDPYYKVWQLHAGVDLAAGGGQPIYAGADGKVVRAGWSGGYGQYTCLYHGEYSGKGLATCYAHQSQILVTDGQFVRRGELIGRVGTTGASTGYHLHFEVRLDGTPVDPLAWLAACLC